MTIPTIALAELAEKGADIDVLRQMVQFMAQRLMEIDVDGRCGAGYDEKTPERLNSRNGYRDRTWDTRAGSVELKIPKLRQGSYFPDVTDRRNGATDVRRIGASNMWVNGRPEGGYAGVDFEGFCGASFGATASCLGARYDCPSSTRQ